MDWQETLRELDARLAGGHVTRSEYIKQRDQVLAQAAGSAAPSLDPDRTQRVHVEEPAPIFTPVPRVAALDGVAVFANSRKPRRRAPAIVAVLVIAALAVSTWWFTRDSTSAADTKATAATASTSASASTPPAVPALPGAAGRTDPEMDLISAVDLKLLSPQEAGLLNDSGVDRFHFATSTELATSYALIVVPTPSAREAAQVANGLNDQLRTAGFTSTPEGRLLLSTPEKAVLRLVYTSGDKVVRVGVAQGPNPDVAQLAKDLTAVLATVQGALPSR